MPQKKTSQQKAEATPAKRQKSSTERIFGPAVMSHGFYRCSEHPRSGPEASWVEHGPVQYSGSVVELLDGPGKATLPVKTEAAGTSGYV